jgi:uncharacterized membrane protein YtjA (UPF0391 family)
MVRWTAGFLAIVIVAALVGFTGIAQEAALAGRWVFCAGLVLAGISLLHGPRTVV